MKDGLRVAVVGAGPAGMTAAASAAERGCSVKLIDENPAPGGQLWRGYERVSATHLPHGAEYLRRLARLRASGAEIAHETAVVDCPAPNILRIEAGGEGQDLEFDRLVIATGARERFLPFPGWTLPGVTGVGGLQALVKSGLPIQGKRVVVAGSGPLLLAVAAGLERSGASVTGIYEQAPLERLVKFGAMLAAHPAKLVEGAQCRWLTRRVPYRSGWWVKRANGGARLESVVITNGSSSQEIPCEFLACGFHLVPNLELAQRMGCRIEERYVAVNAVQETSVHGVFCAGEPTGVGGLEKALVEGEAAGLAAAGQLGKAAELLPARQRHAQFARRLDECFAARAELRALAQGDTILCRCEDVRRKDVEHCTTGREAKLHTRCGMGPCQGRVCGPVTEFLFGWSAASVRPPIYPARIATLAGEGIAPAS